jgi:TFIIF-interacting CTD phosphatase-like protein
VVVLVSVPDENVSHSVSGRFKHLNPFASVSAAGDPLTRLVITSDPVCDSLSVSSIRSDEHTIVCHASAAFDSQDIPGFH